jgi:hypothetical protein
MFVVRTKIEDIESSAVAIPVSDLS